MNNTLSNARVVERLQSTSRIAGVLVITAGCLVILGWLFHITILESLAPGLATMKFNTALAFVVAGIGLFSLRRQPRIAQAAALIVLLIGLLTLAEYLFGWNLGIDQLLVQDLATSQDSFPGRMSPATALNFSLVGTSLLLLVRFRRLRLGQVLALIAAFIALLSLAGYLYDSTSLYEVSIFSSMSLPTTLGFIALGLGTIFAYPEHGLGGVLAAPHAGGLLARRLLPTVIVIPLVVGWLRLQGQYSGLYDTNFGLALFSVSNITVFAVLVFWTAHSLNGLDLARGKQEEQRRLADDAVKRYAQRLAVLREIDRAIIESSSIQAKIGASLVHLRELIPCQMAGAVLFDFASSEAIVFALDSSAESAITTNRRLPLPPGFLEEIGSSAVTVIDDILLLEEPSPNYQQLIKEGMRSSLRAMFRIEGKAIGVLSLAATTPGFFTDEHQEISVEVASQIAIAINHLRLSEELARYTSALEQNLADLQQVELALREANDELEARVQARTAELVQANQVLEQEVTERKRSQTLYTALVEHLPDTAVVMVDTDIRYTLAEGPILERIGYVKGNLLGKTVFEALTPDTLAVVLPLFERVLQGESIRFERHTAGLYYDSRYVPVYDSDGNITNGLVVVQDITARKLADEALRQTEEQLQTIFKLLPVGASLLDNDRQIVQMNVALERILDMKMDDLLMGKYRSMQFIRSDGSPMPPNEFPSERAMTSQRAVHDVEIGAVKSDGTTIWTSVSAAPLPGNQGAVVVTVDINARKRAEEALRNSEELFRATFDYAAVGIALVSLEGRWLKVNPAACEIVGYPEQELLATTFQEVTHPDDLDTDLKYVARLVSGEIDSYQIEKRYFRKSGEVVWVLLSVSLVRDSRGEPMHFVSQIGNITDRKQAEEALRIKLEEDLDFRDSLKALHEITVELTNINDLDEFYKQAVEFGLQRLGFDRLGFLLYDRASSLAIGTYGTDTKGGLVDEHHLRLDPSSLTNILARALEQEQRFVVDTNVALFSNLEPVGTGWNAVAALWDGTEVIGWLTADNGVHHEPASNWQLDILALYAMSLGTQLAQKRTRAALTKSEARFAGVLDTAHDAIISIDANHEIILFNQGAEKIFGHSAEQILGKPIELLIPNRFRGTHDQHISSFTRSDSQNRLMASNRAELKGLRADGTEFFIEASISRVQLDDSFVSTVVIRDITQQHEFEEALKRNEALLRTILDNLPTGVLIADSTGTVIQVNPAVQEIWGGAKYVGIEGYGEYKGWWVDTGKLIQGDDWAAARVFRTGETYLNEEVEIECFDGTHKFILNSAIPMVDDHQNLTGCIIVNQDVTKIKAAEIAMQKTNDQLQQANEEIQRFAYIVSHDLRAPLINLKGFSELLRASVAQIDELSENVVPLLDETQLEVWNTAVHSKIPTALRFINTSVDRMDGFTSAILRLSRMGNSELNYETIVLNDLVDRILQALASQISEQHIKVVVEDLPEIQADRTALDQIMGNIITNSIKYLDPEREGELRIYAEREDEKTTVHVQDNGRGISAEDFEKIFAPFRRAGRITVEGEGMGLAYVKTLVKRHQGRIWFTSTPDIGTTFSFTIPHERG